MKIMGSLAIGLISMIGTTGFVDAATKCVALNSSSSCTGTPTAGKVDWTATCNSIPITGVAVCSSTAGKLGQAADTLATENTTDANTYCWCKMTSPAVSRFVSTYGYGSAANCSNFCALDCVNYAVYNASFRAALFANLE